MFDKAKFKYYVDARGYTMTKMADVLDINVTTLYRKMNGESDFTRAEMQTIKNALALSIMESNEIFFAP